MMEFFENYCLLGCDTIQYGKRGSFQILVLFWHTPKASHPKDNHIFCCEKLTSHGIASKEMMYVKLWENKSNMCLQLYHVVIEMTGMNILFCCVCDELYRMLVRTREGRLDINRRKSARKR
jgi:hypothetical protein